MFLSSMSLLSFCLISFLYCDSLVLLCEIEDRGDGVNMVIVREVILLVLLGLDSLDDGADVPLIEDSLRHLGDVHGGAPEEQLLHQLLDPVKVILVRGASLELNLSHKI